MNPTDHIHIVTLRLDGAGPDDDRAHGESRDVALQKRAPDATRRRHRPPRLWPLAPADPAWTAR